MPHPELAIEFGSRRDPLHPELVPTATTSWQKERAEKAEEKEEEEEEEEEWKKKGRRREKE